MTLLTAVIGRSGSLGKTAKKIVYGADELGG
jgi:hypothetical protein